MGGIAGIVCSNLLEIKTEITTMLATIAHRGAGLSETFSHKNVQLGVCGTCFGTNQSKSIITCVDGSFSNLNELSKILPTSPNSAPDALAYAYELLGIGCLEKIDGNFALAIFDKTKNRLFLARDRIGKKPLYWFNDHNHFIFGSELKALLATGAIPQSPDLEAISAYLTLGYIPQDLSPIEKVNKLLPGHFLEFDLKNLASVRSYWSYSSYFNNSSGHSLSRTLDQLEDLLINTIAGKLSEEPKVGSLADQEMGSSLLNNLILKIDREKSVIPISLSKEPSGSSLEELVKICWHLDEPLASPEAIGLWDALKVSTPRIKTFFSALGSLELLAPQLFEREDQLLQKSPTRLARFYSSLVRKILIPAISIIDPPTALALLKSFLKNNAPSRFFQCGLLFTKQELERAAPKIASLFDTDRLIRKFHNLPRIQSPSRTRLYLDVKLRLADQTLLQYDRLAASFSTELETPFLSRALLELSAGLPEFLDENSSYLRFLLKKTSSTSSTTKPEEKSSVDRNLLFTLFRLLQKGVLVQSELVSEKWLRIHTANEEIMRHKEKQLWSLLALEIWYRLFIHYPVLSNKSNMDPVPFLLAE
jgi:asparagine synthase (glutamine-hydrolysing)